jgi:hypothetical protein
MPRWSRISRPWFVASKESRRLRSSRRALPQPSRLSLLTTGTGKHQLLFFVLQFEPRFDLAEGESSTRPSLEQMPAAVGQRRFCAAPSNWSSCSPGQGVPYKLRSGRARRVRMGLYLRQAVFTRPRCIADLKAAGFNAWRVQWRQTLDREAIG